MRLQRTRLRKGQSVIEYATIAALVILGIIVAGPYVLRSVHAHFKLWDDAAQDSYDDHLIQATNNQVNLEVPDCTVTFSPGACGTASCVDASGNPDPTQRVYVKVAVPTGCDSGYKCETDEVCCSSPTPVSCWRPDSDNSHFIRTNLPAGYHICGADPDPHNNALDRIYQFDCGANKGAQVCKQDTSTDDGNPNCTPACRLDQLPKDGSGNPTASLCPNDGTLLNFDTDIALISNSSACDTTAPQTKCEAYCNTGYHLSGNTCVADVVDPCNHDGQCGSGETCANCESDCGACKPCSPYSASDHNGNLIPQSQIPAACTSSPPRRYLHWRPDAATGQAMCGFYAANFMTFTSRAASSPGDDYNCYWDTADNNWHTAPLTGSGFGRNIMTSINCACYVCGNGICESGESCSICPGDCGSCGGGGGGGGGGGCFVAGTKVLMADGRTVSVETIKEGDKLQGSAGVSTVLQRFAITHDSWKLYAFNGGAYFVTDSHPFMTADGWKSLNPELSEKESPGLKVGLLKVGDELITLTGRVRIDRIDAKDDASVKTVYAFKLDAGEDYYADGFLVHNLTQKF